MSTVAPILAIDRLRIEYPLADGGVLTAVEGATLSIAPGEIHALVGESGAGKTTIGNAVLGLLEKPGRIASGTIALDGQPFDPQKPGAVRLGRRHRRGVPGPDDEPEPALHDREPDRRDAARASARSIGPRRGRARLELLRAVGIPEPERRLSAYPHQLSGGQRQRVVIACALACEPRLLVADEPTTALDVSIQAQILDLLRGLADERGIGILLVTHNMGVVAQIADTVTIMHRGHIVESGPVAQVLRNPQADYAKALIGAVPRIDIRLDRFPMLDGANQTEAGAARDRLRAKALAVGDPSPGRDVPLLSVDNLSVDYGAGFLAGRGARAFRAVDGVSFEIRQGEVFGLVGESGCGKTTIANVVAGLRAPTGGTIRFDGQVIAGAEAAPRKGKARRAIQMIFQDPYSSLNARMRVGRILAEPILFYELARTQAEAQADVGLLIEAVGLPTEAAQRFPHAFSGGQRQRLSIARALGARPRLIVCDEPTSSLDVSVQAQILNLLKDLRDATGLTLLLISHDLAVIRQMCDRVAVMRAGRIVEMAAAETLFTAPQADYTRQLLSLVPTLERIRGEV